MSPQRADGKPFKRQAARVALCRQVSPLEAAISRGCVSAKGANRGRMAWPIRYRLRGPLPPVLNYRNGKVYLEIGTGRDADLGIETWQLRAYKHGAPDKAIVITRHWNRLVFESMLGREFSVDEGTPQAAIMDHLERLGYAERNWGRSTWH